MILPAPTRGSSPVPVVIGREHLSFLKHQYKLNPQLQHPANQDMYILTSESLEAGLHIPLDQILISSRRLRRFLENPLVKSMGRMLLSVPKLSVTILHIEATIHVNKIPGMFDLLSAGQLIPFICTLGG